MSVKIMKCTGGCGAVIEEIIACECPCGYECCGEKMAEEKANTIDAAKEKHVPVAEALENGTKVSVGSVPHPMTEEHSILWIESVEGRRTTRYKLAPGEKPEAFFQGRFTTGTVIRCYCNLHGLWETVIR